jgi:hypothetical protein
MKKTQIIMADSMFLGDKVLRLASEILLGKIYPDGWKYLTDADTTEYKSLFAIVKKCPDDLWNACLILGHFMVIRRILEDRLGKNDVFDHITHKDARDTVDAMFNEHKEAFNSNTDKQ